MCKRVAACCVAADAAIRAELPRVEVVEAVVAVIMQRAFPPAARAAMAAE